MAKARNFKELQAKMPADAQARVAVRVKETLANMSLDQLRAARELTQENLADVLHVNPEGSVAINQFADRSSHA
jgi:DNA-binding XRE family transcriptional regulator